MKQYIVLVVFFVLLLGTLEARAQGVCSYGNASYTAQGRLQSVRIFRHKKGIATINLARGFGIYYVECRGLSSSNKYNTPNDAAWAACAHCK